MAVKEKGNVQGQIGESERERETPLLKIKERQATRGTSVGTTLSLFTLFTFFLNPTERERADEIYYGVE
jgi:hypothetical protein